MIRDGDGDVMVIRGMEGRSRMRGRNERGKIEN